MSAGDRSRTTTAPARAAIGIVLSALALALVPAAARAATTFGSPTVESTFGTGITFRQPVTLDAAPARVELLITTGGSGGASVIDVTPPAGGGSIVLEHRLNTTGTEHVLPNTPFTARWRVTSAIGADPALGPPVSTTYVDDRFTWQTVSGPVVRVHWYQGSQVFGERALRIGEDAIAKTATLLGVTEKEPVDFFVYADQQAFYDALGPGTRENVGGQANAEIRTLFTLIRPEDIDASWVSIVIPHELVHLVFDAAVKNPYHFPPRWLNEGLAVYLSQGFDAGDRSAVANAAKAGTLVPLTGLGGQFPTSADAFSLAYAESVSAVDFFIRAHGQDALVALIRSYADGRTDDEAFTAAIGQDVSGFDAAWLADLGAAAPQRAGPCPAPAGPVPVGWTAAVASQGTTLCATSGTAAPATQSANGPGGFAVGAFAVAALLLAVGAFAVAMRLTRRARDDTAT